MFHFLLFKIRKALQVNNLRGRNLFVPAFEKKMIFSKINYILYFHYKEKAEDANRMMLL